MPASEGGCDGGRAGGCAGARSGRRLPLIAGNWKMNKLSGEARELTRVLLRAMEEQGPPPRGEVLVCPPFTSLSAVAEELGRSPGAGAGIGLGAQDVHWEASGAYTGEVSAAMLGDLGCLAVIVGHSERRLHCGENDALVARKIGGALWAGLTPIVCVGETGPERAAGRAATVLETQVRGAVEPLGVGDEVLGRLVFAYEPVWAIGSGKAASPADAVVAAGLIRGCLPAQAATRVRVLYGGSVKSSNVADFMRCPEVDGCLVGGASLDGREFAALVFAGLKAARDAD